MADVRPEGVCCLWLDDHKWRMVVDEEGESVNDQRRDVVVPYVAVAM